MPQDKPTGPRYKFLLDTNIYIAAEPFGGELPENIELAARLLQLIAEQHHDFFVYPAVRDDLKENRDLVKKQQRLAELAKYPMLQEDPFPAVLRTSLEKVRLTLTIIAICDC